MQGFLHDACLIALDYLQQGMEAVMNVESLSKMNTLSFETTNKEQSNKIESNVGMSNFTITSIETKSAIDEATGLLQTIVTDKLSDEIIRKMPPDEYLQLLSMIDRMIRGTIDKKFRISWYLFC
ncbi:flagellar protein FlaG [Legionella tunisiensis]|uniref:flagellar protein FlaG n=1 Tax=Legionella tunisiensis TaxID=1034944 RepID=UPI0002FFB746|nr:flagellar protein FlaG [Legionella tunisiensis]